MLIAAFGFGISFSSYLPFGNINLAVLEMGAANRWYGALALVVLAAIFEWVYCLVTLSFAPVLEARPGIDFWFSVLIIALLLVLGWWNLSHKPRTVAQHHRSVVGRAIWATVIHPQQVPFWLIWGELLSGRGLQSGSWQVLLPFATGAGLGTIAALACYAFAGKRFAGFIRRRALLFGKIVGILCLAFAAMELAELLRKY